MEEKVYKRNSHEPPMWLCVLFQLMITSGMGIISMYFGAGSEKLQLFGFVASQPKLIFLNLFPLALTAMLVWCLTNRPWIGTLVSGILCLVYSWAEYWKLMARGETIYAEDLTVIREALEMSGRYISITWQIVLSLILVVCSVVFMAVVFRKKRIRKLPLRIGLCFLSVLAGAAAYLTAYTSDNLYESFPIYGDYDVWVDNNRYLSTGSFYPFIHTIQAAIHTAPEGYSANQAKEILSEYEEADIPEESKVSVICVMLEAMADFSKYTDVITENDPYALYHQMESESYSGQLATNIFSGGTINTERSVVTGFWKFGSFRSQSWSYARYFQEQGYLLDGAHAGEEKFYNRQQVNENLGFYDYRFIENYYCGFVPDIPWDDVFLPDITSVFLEKVQSGPVFSFNVTYQNHGPYPTDERYFDTEYVPADAVNSETYYVLNNYLSGVASTWEKLMVMVDAFEASDQPIVLVLFGDHKPWLGDQESCYHALGIDLSMKTTESYYNYYTTDYMIWANQAAKKATGNDFSGTGPTVSSCYLMNLVFQQCGWEGASLTKLTDQMMEILPVTSSNGKFLYHDQIVAEDALDEQTREALLEMDQVRYYLEYDYMRGK